MESAYYRTLFPAWMYKIYDGPKIRIPYDTAGISHLIKIIEALQVRNYVPECNIEHLQLRTCAILENLEGH